MWVWVCACLHVHMHYVHEGGGQMSKLDVFLSHFFCFKNCIYLFNLFCVHVWRSTSRGQSSFFHHVDPDDQTLITGLGDKCLTHQVTLRAIYIFKFFSMLVLRQGLSLKLELSDSLDWHYSSLCGFWDLNSRSSHLYSKGFTDWPRPKPLAELL